MKAYFVTFRLLATFFVMLLFGCKSEETIISTSQFSFADRSMDVGSPEYFTFWYDNQNILVTWSDNHNVSLYGIEWTQLDLSFLVVKSMNQHIDVIAYAPYEEDLILVLTVGNVHSGSSRIVRVDGNEFSLKWSVSLFGFGIGTPIIKNSMLYVSSIGTVGKVNLQTGEYLWLHENLYDQETTDFNSFKMPAFHEDRVIFQGETFGSCPKRIEVDDRSGKVIGVFETCRTTN